MIKDKFIKPIDILLVEDNPGDADLIKEMLPGNGPVSFDIENVDRLSEVLERAGQKKFDIILLDLGLPDSMGLDTVRTIRAQIADTPIVVLTGTNDEQMGLAAIQEGAQDYLIKGQVNSSLLIRTIHYAIERKRAEDEIHNLNTSLEQKVISRTEELQKSEERYRVLYESSRDAIMLITPDTGFFAGNPAAIELFGCRDEKEFTTHAPSDLSPEFQPDGLPSSTKALEMMKTALEKGSHYFEWMHKRVDGAVFPATVLLTRVQTRDKIYLQATVRDITENRRFEIALRESEKKYRQIVELAQEGIWNIDSDSLTTYVNPRMAEMLGYKVDEMLGKHLFDFMDSKGIENCKYYLERRSQGIVEEHEFEFLKKSGEKIYTNLSTSPIIDKKGDYMGALALVSDVSERKAADRRIRQSEELHRSIANVSPDIIAVIGIDGLIDYASEKCVDILGLESKDEVIGNPVLNWIVPDDHERALNNIEKVFSGQTLPSIEYTSLRKDGSTFPVDINANVLLDATGKSKGLVVIIRDITEKKKSEDILKRSHEELERLVEERTSELKKTNQTLMEEVIERKRAEYSYATAVREWSATFDAFNDPVWLLDLSGKILRSNKAASDVFNIDPTDLIGKKCWEIVHQTKTPVEECPFVRMKTTKKREEMEFKLGEKYIQITVDPVVNSQGDVIGAVHILRNITESRSLEEQFRQSQKMESLGIVASGIAHDFNNLFQVITGNIELATLNRQMSEKSKNYLSNSMAALNHAARLTGQMTAYAGKSIFFPVNINLNEVIRDVEIMLDASIPKNVRVDYKLAPGLPDILSDQTQMTQIIMNLMINAYEAIGDNSGTISISTGAAYFNQQELDSLWIKEPLEAGEYVFLEVKDTGCGMDTVTLEKLFDPFFTTNFIGRGLGLSAVQGILRAHKGTVKLESKPGEGTTFRVFLPVSKKSEKSAEVETPVMEKKKSPGIILIVDDDELVLNVGANMLIESGFEVIKAVDSIQALKILTDDRKSSQGARISCIVLDIAMPGMGGGQTLAKIKEIYPEMPVIIISGYPEDVAQEKLKGMEFPPFLKKPFTMAELVNLIDDMMRS